MHDATDIRAQLEEERRIIEAIDLPPLEMEGFGDVDGYTRLSLYAGSPYDPDVEVVANDIRRARSAVRLQHSWNALPVRNAQVAAVLRELDIKRSEPRDDFDRGADAARAMIRRIIEEAA